MVQNEVNNIARLPGPIERNAAITAAYDKLAKDMPENDWVRLASYVSVQGGCAMKLTQGGMAGVADYVPFMGFDSAKSLQALGDANLTIFSSIYPPNRMVANCGYAKFKECVASGEIKVNRDIVAAIDKMQNGDLKGAADAIALHEQRDVVQPVYERWKDTFSGMSNADSLDIFNDRTSIPISKSCGTGDPVVLNGDISNWRDRVSYYNKLITEMYRIEGR